MADYDLVVRGGTVVTESDTMRADIRIRDGRIAALGEKLDGAATLDAGILAQLSEYQWRARQSMVDYSFHQIITDGAL